MTHVALQHVVSLQPGLAWPVKQSPSAGQLAASGHTPDAIWTQRWSHSSVQQLGSTLHTARMHSGTAHPGAAWVTRHDSRPIWVGKVGTHTKFAWYAQIASHRMSQQ
jgi:hypothetical protein